MIQNSKSIVCPCVPSGALTQPLTYRFIWLLGKQLELESVYNIQRFERYSVTEMANLLRLAKLGNSRSTNDMEAYNISVVEQHSRRFLVAPSTGSPGFLQYEDWAQGLDATSPTPIK